MSDITKKFYNLFWQNQSCQNLFLLSKEELLETKTFGSENKLFSFSTNRVIISNARNSDSDAYETIKLRTESHNIDLDTSIGEKIEYFQPIIEQFFNSKFKKSFDKLIKDFENNSLKMIGKIFKIVVDETNREEKIIELIKGYGFVPKNLNSFKEIENHFQRQLIPSKGNELINEQTINTFFEGIKFAKELYVNHSYKKLYSTNQILVNTLNSDDNFESRIKLFHLLYESKIIAPSKEDAFIECSHCEPLTYKGVFQLRLNPKKLKDLKCPVCSKELTYFVPYELHKEIYDIVKSQDGLLLDAYCNILDGKYHYQKNQRFLDNIEIDCIFNDGKYTYIVEVKMYKLNTESEKLKSKIREHFGKLIKDVGRLQNLQEYQNIVLKPILLINVIDNKLVQEIELELKQLNDELISENSRILNLSLLQNKSNIKK